MIKEFWNWFVQNEIDLRIAFSHQDDTPGNVIEHLFAKLDSFSPQLHARCANVPMMFYEVFLFF